MRVTVAGQVLEVPEGADVSEELAQWNASIEANPLNQYVPHVKQLPFHTAQTRTKMFLGGNRAGKSTAGAVDDLIQALDDEWVPDHLKQFKKWQPPFKCRVFTPDLLDTLQEVLDALQKWCPQSQLKGGSWDTAYRRDVRLLTLANGSRFDFKSFETDLDKMGGVARHRIRYDEEPPGEKGQHIRKRGLQRLRDYHGDEVFTLTPEFGLSWLYDVIWEQRGPQVEERVWANDELVIVRSATFDNPHVPPDEKADEAMTEEEYKVKVLGEFFHIKGLVYDEFDLGKHRKPLPEDPKAVEEEKRKVRGLQTIVGIDPGYRTTAVTFVGFDKDNAAYVYDELYLHKQAALPGSACEQIKLKLSEWGVKTSHFVIDPNASVASLQSGKENVEAAYQREGIHVIPGNNKVEAGILEVKGRLQSDHTALLISARCQKLLWERERYRIDDKEDGKFAVVKTNDHALDSLRYALMERTWFQAPSPARKKHPTFGEQPTFEPPFRPLSPAPETSPLGSYT